MELFEMEKLLLYKMKFKQTNKKAPRTPAPTYFLEYKNYFKGVIKPVKYIFEIGL